MTKLLKGLGLGTAVALLSVATAGRAATFTFNTCGTGGGTGNCHSTTETFTVNGISITATAFAPPGSTANLYAKNGTGDEIGLGLTNDGTGDHEITPGSFIQLDLSNVPVVPLTIVMDSTTSPDEWQVYESNSPGATSGIIDATGSNEAAFTIIPPSLYLDFTSLHGNELLSSLSFDTTPPVPEPSSLALLGSSILGLAGVVRRKMRA